MCGERSKRKQVVMMTVFSTLKFDMINSWGGRGGAFGIGRKEAKV